MYQLIRIYPNGNRQLVTFGYFDELLDFALRPRNRRRNLNTHLIIEPKI